MNSNRKTNEPSKTKIVNSSRKTVKKSKSMKKVSSSKKLQVKQKGCNILKDKKKN